MNMVTRKSVMYMQLIYWGCFTSPKHFRISTLQDKQEHDQSDSTFTWKIITCSGYDFDH